MIKVSESGEEFYIFQLGETLHDAELQIFSLVFKNNGGNKSKTAATLGVSLSTIKNWIRRYEIGKDEINDTDSGQLRT